MQFTFIFLSFFWHHFMPFSFISPSTIPQPSLLLPPPLPHPSLALSTSSSPFFSLGLSCCLYENKTLDYVHLIIVWAPSETSYIQHSVHRPNNLWYEAWRLDGWLHFKGVSVCVLVVAVLEISGRLITAIGLQTTSCHCGYEAHKSIQVDCVIWFPAPVSVEFQMGAVWVSELIVFRPVRHYE